MGGHAANLVFKDGKLIKKTAVEEAYNYRAINGCSAEGDPERTEGDRKQLEALKWMLPAYVCSDDKKDTMTLDG